VAEARARVVLIPGADTADGVSLARAIAGIGHPLVLCGIDQVRLGALAGELRDGEGVQVAVFCGDPANDDDRAALAEMVEELFARRET
jgi:short-subunit dehydrogenase